MFRDIHNIGTDTPELIVKRACSAMARHQMTHVGISDAGRDYEMERTGITHDHIQICYGGSGLVWVNDRWQECVAGQAYLMPRQIPCRFKTIPGQRWQFCWLYFLSPEISEKSPTLISVDPWPMQIAISGLYREYSGPADMQIMNRWAEVIYLLLERLLRGEHGHDPLWRVWEKVEADMARPWRLGDLAELAATSDETLRRISLKHNGRSPMDQVTYLRMRHAAALLTTTQTKIEQIARIVGYESRFAFAAAFRRCMKMTPGECRRRQGENAK